MIEFELELKGDNVKLNDLSSQLTIAIFVATGIYARHGYKTIITSLNDSKHSVTSLHYSGNGVDLRTRHVKTQGEKKQIRKEIKNALNCDYDVILESTHIHIEYQPKLRSK